MQVYVVYDSKTGNTEKLAQAIADGTKQISGVTVVLKKVGQIDPNELENADAICLGSPDYFGQVSAEMKQFIDGTIGLWMKGKLIGKVGAVFATSNTFHGGKEATLLTMLLPLLHHGMIIVGLPYGEKMPKSGSFYGATSSGEPNPDDLEQGRALGKRVAELTKKICG